MKKSIAALLAALMLLPAVACAKPSDSTDTGPSASTADTTDGSLSSIETEVGTEGPPAVEKQDFKGETFHMIAQETPVGAWYYADEFISSGEKIHILNNTIYEMNTMVEEHLGMEFTYENIPVVTTGDILYNTVRRSMHAGDDEYQLCIMHPYYSTSSFVLSNQAYDFYALEDLDLDRAYWNGDTMDLLSINDHAYIGVGDICNYGLYMLYVNRDMLADAGRKTPYDQVRNGTWTLDEFISITTGLYEDSSGDGLRDNRDTYGFSSIWDVNGSAFLQASDIYVLTRNKENAYEFSMYGDRLVDVYDKIYKWSQDESIYTWSHKQNSDESIRMDFHDRKAYFTLYHLGTDYLDADFTVGILPLPKYDVAQEEYVHVNWGNNLIIPSTIENPEMVGSVLEMMAYYSRTHVRETYYNDVLQLRVSEAPDDREMVELICNTVVCDPGIAYCFGNDGLYNLVYTLTSCIRESQPNVASYYTRNERNAQKVLKKLNDFGT